MKKITALLLALIMALSLAACGEQTTSLPSGNSDTSESVSDKKPSSNSNSGSSNGEAQTNPSTDKYTYYVKDYIGKNAASIGCGGFEKKFDPYGNGALDLIFLVDDGSYIDINDEEELKNYVVTGQNLPPNTEIKMQYEVDEDGIESDWYVIWQSYDEIELYISKIN